MFAPLFHTIWNVIRHILVMNEKTSGAGKPRRTSRLKVTKITLRSIELHASFTPRPNPLPQFFPQSCQSQMELLVSRFAEQQQVLVFWTWSNL